MLHGHPAGGAVTCHCGGGAKSAKCGKVVKKTETGKIQFSFWDKTPNLQCEFAISNASTVNFAGGVRRGVNF